MFAIIGPSGGIWINDETGQYLIFSDERSAWRFLLRQTEEKQSISRIIPITWVRK